MKKIFIFIFFAIIFPGIAMSAVTGITFTNTGDSVLNPNDTDEATMQIDISDSGTGDTLTSLICKNLGTADEPVDIDRVELWYQAGGGAFNAGSAVLIGTLAQTALKEWRNESLSFSVADGSALYITVDISSAPVDARTIKMTVLRNGISFAAGGTFPTKNTTNGITQTIDSPPKILASYDDVISSKVNAGRQDVYAVRYNFTNTNNTGNTLTDIRLYMINHAGEAAADSAVSRIVLRDSSGAAVADISTIPSSSYIDINISGGLTLAGNTAAPLDVYIYLLPAINTKDIGVRLLQGADLTLGTAVTIEPNSGFSFPMDSSLAEITQPVSSVTQTGTDTAPSDATDAQAGVDMLLLTYTHPQSVTTYADCAVKGLTLNVLSLTTPALTDDDMFSRIKIYDSVTTYADVTFFGAVNTPYIPFDTELLIPANSAESVTISVDIKNGMAGENFYIYVSQPADVLAVDGSDTINALAVNGTFPQASSAVTVLSAPSNAGIHHASRIPANANTGQQDVYAMDLVFTHPDSGAYADIEIRGLTITTEDNLGAGIIPDFVISGITLLDSANNTIFSTSAVPSYGDRIYIDFTTPVVIAPAAGDTIKILFDVTNTLNGDYLKLNLNSGESVNAVDFNSGARVTVLADSGDAFPMKTNSCEILNPAIDVKATHNDTMPESGNEGQNEITAMTLYFFNDRGGVVSIEGLTLGVYDDMGNSVAANTVVDNIRVDDYDNTNTAYVDTAVVSATQEIDVAFSSPVVVNMGAANAVTVNVKADIAGSAAGNNFKLTLISAQSIDSVDYNTGNTITAIALNDSFEMDTGFLYIEERANTLNAGYDGLNSGSALKGDANVHIMGLTFENPGSSSAGDILITGLTLTAEDTTVPINANTALTKVYICDAGNTALVYGQITSVPAGEYLYFNLSTPISVAGAGSVQVTVKANVAAFATAPEFRLNLKHAEHITAYDENEMTPVSVTAKSPDVFPNMRSDMITIVSSNKVTVLHEDTMPSKVSQGQQGIAPMRIRFSNATDDPIAVHGVTLTVEDSADAGIVPDSIIANVKVMDSSGNTNIAFSSIPSAGGKIYLTFSTDIDIAPSSYEYAYIYVDIRNNTYNSNFQLNLGSSSHVDALPSTLTVQAEAGDFFPMRSGNALTQFVPVEGGIAHTDVIPTTVSTGQTDIFAEILSIVNYNVTGSADVMLTGITITVEDDTNTAIDPSTAIKGIMARGESNVYTMFSSIPAVTGSFYVPFTTPVYVSVSSTTDIKLYVDIVDTLAAGNFKIDLVINDNINFLDANSGNTITARAINGDSFPMRTSTVIIQQKAALCEVFYTDVIPPAVNKGQQGVTGMKLSFFNPGGESGANVLITRVVLYAENSSDSFVIPSSALSRIYIKDSGGTIYGDVVNVPDFGGGISIGLTTPITIQPGETKDVIAYCDIDTAASAAGFKLDLKTGSNVIARDANSYDIIPAQALSGYSFPMRTPYAQIQSKSDTISVSHYGSITATVNKGDADIETIYFEFTNSNPLGCSAIQVKGLTLTTENDAGIGIIPGDVIDDITISDGMGNTYGVSATMPVSGTSVYVPLTVTALTIPAAGAVGVTVYAGIKADTTELYFQLDLKQPAHINAVDVNSSEALSAVSGSFPMRSGYTTINSPPGINISGYEFAPSVVSGGQQNIGVISLRFDNIGSFSSDITGITLTVKESDGTDADASALISSIAIVDDYSTTYTVQSSISSGAKVYVSLTTAPITVLPQDFAETNIFIDMAAATFSSSFYMGVSLASDVVAADPAGGTLPVYTSGIILQQAAQQVEISGLDIMPPTVSTGQQEVYVMVFTVENTSAAGYSPVFLTDITLTVKNSSDFPIDADTAISGVKLSDLTDTYIDTSSISSSEFLSLSLPAPVSLTAGERRDIYVIVDITGNTNTMADNFKISLDSAGFVSAEDYNSGAYVTVAAKAAYTFPVESSAASIQKKATELIISGIDKMPVNVSTGQVSVTAMDLVLADNGDSDTASIMITRFNFYIQDAANTNINPADVIKAVKVMSEDGLVTYGGVTILASTKITVNLSSPIVVSTASPVTVSVRVDIAPVPALFDFKMDFETETDVYVLDANSFQVVSTVSGTFPVKSGIAHIQEKAAQIDLKEFTPLLPAGVTKGQAGVDFMSFKVENNNNSLSARALFDYVQVYVRDSSGFISAGTAFENIRMVDGDGNTMTLPSSPNSQSFALQNFPDYIIPPQTAVYVTVTADIKGTATASEVKMMIWFPTSFRIIDENSGYRIEGVTDTAMPWETGLANIYDAPATDLYVRHDGTNWVPSQVGRGQSNIKFMSLSLYNHAGEGTSDIVLQGVTITAYDSTGNSLAPDSVLEFLEVSNFGGDVCYGGTTTTSIGAPEPVYIEMNSPLLLSPGNTKTVYVEAKIATAAALTTFKLVIDTDAYINAFNNPAGYVTITAQSGSFPMETDYTNIIATTNIVNVGHYGLMPVSVEKGREGLGVLRLDFENDSGIDMRVNSITVRVKNREGHAIAADSVISALRVTDPEGNTLYGNAVPGPSGAVSVDMTGSPGFGLEASRAAAMIIAVDVRNSASGSFQVELESADDIETDLPSSIQAASGDYFGNMKSGVVSIQEANLEQSYHNYPNPFNPETEVTNIEYYLPNASEVTIKIFTLDGKPVKTVIDKVNKTAGLHSEDTWGALNDISAKVKSGVYLCVLEVTDSVTGENTKLITKLAVLR